jgi:hypothetical protein
VADVQGQLLRGITAPAQDSGQECLRKQSTIHRWPQSNGSVRNTQTKLRYSN